MSDDSSFRADGDGTGDGSGHETDHVIEVVYPDRTDVMLAEQREYGFPRSRLELETPVHDRDDDGDQEADR